MLFHATTKTNTQTQQVTALILDTSDPGETHTFSGRRIVIPPVAPSYLAGCNIIDIRYYVEVSFIYNLLNLKLFNNACSRYSFFVLVC